jgi:hypothetical protein
VRWVVSTKTAWRGALDLTKLPIVVEPASGKSFAVLAGIIQGGHPVAANDSSWAGVYFQGGLQSGLSPGTVNGKWGKNGSCNIQ